MDFGGGGVGCGAAGLATRPEQEDTSLREDREKNTTEQMLEPKQLAEQGLEPERPPRQALRGGTLKASRGLTQSAVLPLPHQRDRGTGEQKSVCVCVGVQREAGVGL